MANGYIAQGLPTPLVEIMRLADIYGDGVVRKVVYIEELGDRDLLILVPTATIVSDGDAPVEQNNFAEGDEIEVLWSGITSSGEEVRWSDAMMIMNMSPAEAFIIPMPNDRVKALIGTTATLSYQLTCGVNSAHAGKVFQSTALEIAIVGVNLPKPIIVEAIGDSVDPDKLGGTDGARYATLLIDYPGMQLGDVVEVYRNYKVVEELPVSDSNLTRRPLKFQWSQADLAGLSGDVITAHYVVYRGQPEKAYTSRVATYRIGPSLGALPPFITELNQGRLEPGSYIEKIYVHIPPAATLVGDVVNLYWVGAGEAGSFRDRLPVTTRNVNGDLKFDVYDSVIMPNARRVVKVYYTISRLINDRSVLLRSPELMFFVGTAEEQAQLDQSGGLGQIHVKEAPSGNLDTTPVAEDATLIVPFSVTQVDDEVSVYWKVEGEADSVAIGTQLVDLQNVDDDLSFIAPAALVQSSVGKRVSIHYIIKRRVNGEATYLESPFTVIRVGPLSGDQLLPPKVAEADDENRLDPMRALAGATVVVPAYPGMAIGDVVKAIWAGGPGPGSPDLAAVTVSAAGPLQVNVPASAIAYSLNRDVLVSYEVTRAGQSATIYSPSASITVQGFYGTELPVPNIAQAPNKVLDLSTAPDPITVVVKQWPLIAAGQRYWLRLEGITADNKPLVINARIAQVIDSAALQSQLTIQIAKSEFASLKSGSRLRVFFRVAWDADIDESKATLFPQYDVDIKQVGKIIGTVLTIDSRDMNLGGFFTMGAGSSSANQPSAFRTASGGRTPYRYTSANPAVAMVDSGTGKVTAQGNGVTVITVTDQDGASVAYRVIVTGVYALEKLPEVFNTYALCSKSATQSGLKIPTLQEWRSIKQMNKGTLDLPYLNEPGQQRDHRVWTQDVSALKRISYYPEDDTTKPLTDMSLLPGIPGSPLSQGGETAHGFGLRE
jgi:hypothetical protein